jgi:hypothetical protein
VGLHSYFRAGESDNRVAHSTGSVDSENLIRNRNHSKITVQETTNAINPQYVFLRKGVDRLIASAYQVYGDS